MESTRGLAIDLYRQVRSKTANLMMSPYSIWMAVAMMLPGARGKTREQLVSRLGIDDASAVKALGVELARRAEPTKQQADFIERGYQKNEGLGFHLAIAKAAVFDWQTTGASNSAVARRREAGRGSYSPS